MTTPLKAFIKRYEELEKEVIQSENDPNIGGLQKTHILNKMATFQRNSARAVIEMLKYAILCFENGSFFGDEVQEGALIELNRLAEEGMKE